MVISVGYKQVYGLDGEGIERVKREIAEFGLKDILEICAKLSLTLYANGFANPVSQVKLIKDIFADDLGTRKLIAKAIRSAVRGDREKTWAVFIEQSLLNLYKIALLSASREANAKIVEVGDVKKVGVWLLILNDLCMDTGITEVFKFPPEIEREIMREHIARQHFFMESERMPYRVVRFRSIFQHIRTNHPDFKIDDYFDKATSGTKLDDYLFFCFYLMVNWINKQNKQVEVTKEWIICKEKYFEQTVLSSEEIDSVLAVLELDYSNFEINYQGVIDTLLNGNDEFALNFLQFRQRPFIRCWDNCFVCVSPDMLMDKSTDGIYWILENYLKEIGDTSARKRLPELWGEGFESYINERWEGIFKKRYFSNPMHQNNEILDGIAYGEKTVFMIETKYAHWSYSARLTGRKKDMQNTLDKVFSGEVKVKGLGQIANTIRRYTRGEVTLPEVVGDRDIQPIIVVGEGLPIEPIHWKLYEEMAIKSGSYCEGGTVRPFIILDGEEVEILEGIASKHGKDTVEELLRSYSSIIAERNEEGYSPRVVQFKHFLHSLNFPEVNNPTLFKKFKEIHVGAVRKGFKQKHKSTA